MRGAVSFTFSPSEIEHQIANAAMRYFNAKWTPCMCCDEGYEELECTCIDNMWEMREAERELRMLLGWVD